MSGKHAQSDPVPEPNLTEKSRQLVGEGRHLQQVLTSLAQGAALAAEMAQHIVVLEERLHKAGEREKLFPEQQRQLQEEIARLTKQAEEQEKETQRQLAEKDKEVKRQLAEKDKEVSERDRDLTELAKKHEALQKEFARFDNLPEVQAQKAQEIEKQIAALQKQKHVHMKAAKGLKTE